MWVVSLGDCLKPQDWHYFFLSHFLQPAKLHGTWGTGAAATATTADGELAVASSLQASELMLLCWH
jgi:hypothetical protein